MPAPAGFQLASGFIERNEETSGKRDQFMKRYFVWTLVLFNALIGITRLIASLTGSIDNYIFSTEMLGFVILIVVFSVLGALIILIVSAVILFVANRLNMRVEGDVDRSYQRLGSWARWLGIFYKPTDTPYERADMMSTAVPEGRAPIRNLTHEYVRKQFSGKYEADGGFDSLSEWKQLRPMLIRQTIAKRIQRWQKRFRKQE